MHVRTSLVIACLVLLIAFAVGTVGYVVFQGQTWGDAALITLVMISTVGDHDVLQLDTAGRLWTGLVITFGVLAVYVVFGTLVATVVGGEIGRVLGRRKLETRIGDTSGHVIVCGYGRMGQTLAKLLQERGVPVVVIDIDAQRMAQVDEKEILYVVGDASEEDVLLSAGLGRARGLVAVLPSDSANVYVTLTARSLCPDVYIVARAEQLSTEPKLRRAGASRVVSPQAIGAAHVVNVLTRPHVVDFVDVAAKGVELEMDEYVVTPDSSIRGMTLRESNLRQRAEVMVVAIRRADGTSVFNPGPDEAVEENDTLIMIGKTGASNRLRTLNIT